MAELIVKEVLDNEHIYVIETDGSIHKMIFCGDCDWDEKPVTSLAEIRANAIEEFAEKLKEELRDSIIHDEQKFKYERKTQERICVQNVAFKLIIKLVDEIAEQLKEE